MTVEAAVVLPFFLMFLVMILSLFQMMAMELTLAKALDRTGRQIAAGYYAAEGVLGTDKEESFAETFGKEAANYVFTTTAAAAMVLHELNEKPVGASIVKGGIQGLSFLGSHYDKESGDIILRVSCEMNIPFFSVFPIHLTVIRQSVHHAWIGQRLQAAEESEEKYVYVTEYGKVYHETLSCSYLSRDIREVPFTEIQYERSKDGSRYYLCEFCGDGIASTVFITDYGDRYHYNRNCSRLYRNIKSIPLSEIGDRGPCSKCGGT